MPSPMVQFELYSARVREFEVLGRQSHPRTDGFGSGYARGLNSSQWRLMGNFTGGWVGGWWWVGGWGWCGWWWVGGLGGGAAK